MAMTMRSLPLVLLLSACGSDPAAAQAAAATAAGNGPDAAAIAAVAEMHVQARNSEAAAAGSQESFETTDHATADLDGDGRPEIVLLTAMYGPTYWAYHVSVYTDRGAGYAHAASSTGPLGLAESLDVAAGGIQVHGKWPGPNDPRCCPTVDRTVTLRWQGNALSPVE